MTILVLAPSDYAELHLLSELPNSFNVIVNEDPTAVGEKLKEVEIVLLTLSSNYQEKIRFLLNHCPRLHWIHTRWTGVDALLFPELQESQVVLTNARGAYAEPLAEFALGACVYFAKEFPRLLRNQREKCWDPFESQLLRGRTLSILGYGEIGRATARLAKAFGMQVVACRRSPEKSSKDELVDQILSLQELPQLFRCADYMVISTPLTPETKGLVSKELLAELQQSSVLINVGRGPVVDEDALTDALLQGRIRGAALDVFSIEPLPPSSPLWELENVLISPHSADRYCGWLEEPIRMFTRNCKRLASGENLLYQVDKYLGY